MAKSKIDKNGEARIKCKECSEWFHRLDVHLKIHSMTVKQYMQKHPGAATISESASQNASKAQQGNMPPQARKAAGVPASPTGDNIFKIGVARLQMRADKELDAIDKARIPKHDIHWIPGPNELKQWEYAALGVMTKDPVFLFGPTGCGKTSGVNELGAALNQPVRRIQGNKDWDMDAFAGYEKPVIDSTTGKRVMKWVDGILTEAIRRGWWFLLDEMDAMPPDILLCLQGVLEDGVLILVNGEVVKPHENFRLFATGNTNGRGDETGLYAGTHILNEATLDRFGVVIAADYPDKPTEIQILVDRTGIEQNVAGKMVEIAIKVREALKQEACGCTFSTRRLIKWAEKAQLLGDNRAASKITVVNKLSGDDSRFVDGLIQRYFGGDV